MWWCLGYCIARLLQRHPLIGFQSLLSVKDLRWNRRCLGVATATVFDIKTRLFLFSQCQQIRLGVNLALGLTYSLI